MIKVGDKIRAIDENRLLVVQDLCGKASNYIDFLAGYTHSNTVDRFGNRMLGNRGFIFNQEGIIWEKVEKD